VIWHRVWGPIIGVAAIVLFGLPLVLALVVSYWNTLAMLVSANWTMHGVGMAAACLAFCVAPTTAACLIAWRMDR
jgi:hypothetical protein